jgi:Zn-dependent M28 family amino/carboxypeptidase
MKSCRAGGVVIAVALALGAAAGAQPAAPMPLAVDAAAVWKDFERLASPDLQGRRTGSDGNATARRLIVERFGQAGLKPAAGSFELPFRFTRNGTNLDGVNVVGVCVARAAVDDRVMVVSAHYDHVGIRNDEVYPGADDNASGVAGLLALASMCRKEPWTHDVLFAAFDAEEQGLQGARAFVASPPVPARRLALNVNLDMVSRSDTREIYVAGTAHRPELRTVLEPVAARSKAHVRFGHDRPGEKARGVDDWTMQSDHGAFHAAGIPFIYFGVEDHRDYHRPTDTIEKVNAAFFMHVVATIFDATQALDKALPAARP